MRKMTCCSLEFYFFLYPEHCKHAILDLLQVESQCRHKHFFSTYIFSTYLPFHSSSSMLSFFISPPPSPSHPFTFHSLFVFHSFFICFAFSLLSIPSLLFHSFPPLPFPSLVFLSPPLLFSFLPFFFSFNLSIYYQFFSFIILSFIHSCFFLFAILSFYL